MSSPFFSPGPQRQVQAGESKPNPIHILLFCLAVAAAIFAGSLILSVFYVANNHGIQTDQPPDPQY